MKTLRLSEYRMTEKQRELLDKTYRAAKFLRDNGFDCEVIEYLVFKSSDHAADIRLK